MFLERFNKIVDSIVSEAPGDLAPPAGAPAPGMPLPAAPAPVNPAGQTPAPGQGEPGSGAPEPAKALAPAAEVTLVRLMLKALVINLEDNDLSTLEKLDQPEINQENVDQVKKDIISLVSSHATRGDNEERLDRVSETSGGINEKNRKYMLNKFVNVMKKYSDVDIKT